MARDRYVIGVDFGTLSGRAVVVRVSDGAELGRRVGEYPHGVHRPDAARRRRRCRRTGRCRSRPTTSTCCGTAVPAALRDAGHRPGRRDRHRHRLHRLHGAAVLADGTPLCELPELRRPPARLREAVEAPRGAAAGRPDQRARRTSGSEPWLPRYGGLISSEWEFAKALQLLEEDPEIYAATDAGSRRPTGSSGSSAATLRRNACTAGYKGIYQDGSYPSADFLAALNPDFADFVDRQARRDRSASSAHAAGTLTAEAAALDRAAARASRSRSATSTRTSPRRPRRPIEPGQMVAIMGTSTCHVMNGDVLAEVPGMCGVVDGGIIARARAATRPARAASATSSPGSSTRSVPAALSRRGRDAAGLTLHEYLTALARRPAGRRARPGRARLAQRQPVGPGRPRPVRA